MPTNSFQKKGFNKNGERFKQDWKQCNVGQSVGFIEKVVPSTGRPICAVQEDGDWQWVNGGITVDSGAAESVMPREMFSQYPVRENAANVVERQCQVECSIQAHHPGRPHSLSVF